MQETKEDAATSKGKWLSMKEEFLELCITGKDVHWPTLAAKYGKHYQTARNKASTEKWYEEIETRRKNREDILEAKHRERTQMALDEVNKDFATNEAAIRKRHATIARGLQVRAVARLRDMKIEDFSAKDALTMLQIGLREERYALGMPETAEHAPEDTGSQPSEYKSITEQVGGLKKVQTLGAKILQFLATTDLEAVEDVVPKARKDVSDGSMQVIAKRHGRPIVVHRGGNAAKRAEKADKVSPA